MIPIITLLLLIFCGTFIINLKKFRKSKLFKKVKFFFGFLEIDNFLKHVEIAGILLSILGLMYTFIQSEQASIESKHALDNSDYSLILSKDANRLAKESSEQSNQIANKTIKLLDSISNSSQSLNSNMDTFSTRMSNINKYLLILTKNLNSIDSISTNQLKNLSAIVENLKNLLRISQNEDSLRYANLLKTPNVIFNLKCIPDKNKFLIIAKNIGTGKCTLQYDLKPQLRLKTQDLSLMLGVGEEIITGSFTNSNYFIGDSVHVEIIYSFTGENEKTITREIKYLKCE